MTLLPVSSFVKDALLRSDLVLKTTNPKPDALTCSRKDFPPLDATTNQGDSPCVEPGHGAVVIEPVVCSRESQRWRRQSLSSNASDEKADECHVEDVLSRMLLLYHGSKRRRGSKFGDAGMHRGGAEDTGWRGGRVRLKVWRLSCSCVAGEDEGKRDQAAVK
ncbi:hypothetical protein ACFX2I_002500 [Malus domestica]